ncbi:MAG: glycosyltransferase family 4 protein [Methanomassiliicoccus sp.]|nr:glycosyltransferase family 4 protein [Methanomassiliicoccus sp.]
MPDQHKGSVIMVGPLPPPNGGVANFVRNMRDFLPYNGFEVTVFRTGGSGSRYPFLQPLRDLRAVISFNFTSKRYRADIVHVHTSSYYSFLRNVPYINRAKRIARAVVVHIHGGMFKEFYEQASSPTRWLVRRTLGKADAVLVTSPSWVDSIGPIVGKGREVLSLPNGFDARAFRPGDRDEARRALGIPVEGRVLVTVGYLEPIKGHAHLIEAMAEVGEQVPDARLFILGDGSLRQKLADRVAELHLTEMVQFVHPPMPSSSIAQWMTAADVFVLPSLGEGNPTVMFECLGCGRPFVGTRVGGIPDIISSEKLGLLCPPGDSASLAKCIEDALDRRWDADEIATQAQRYAWPNLADQLSAVYLRLLTEHR